MKLEDNEKIQLLTDINLIKDSVMHMRPAIKKNTTFRLYATGFVIIFIALTGLALNLYRLSNAMADTPIKISEKAY